ncbi:PKD domain-containing protein [Cyclobacterium jeungdonense]|uniref:Gliding motility-associated C-terminal domain-containing protein n=1 Tax=Cyclobacterium jeungdonense TaxID=708087 RepID=A0ABT8CD99_9BACT|nr:PKD domain-containing protein [Cyclobacterium jeungdonense]MDN3690377.1 gliding motility-associated C-terminal domain-containing protein [Cyclobacterium jeungdonense]
MWVMASLMVGLSIFQSNGNGWNFFAPITITGQEDVSIYYDETKEITLDMLSIDYDGDPDDLIIQVLDGTGYNRSENSIIRTIEYDDEWAAAGEEISVNVRVSDGADQADFELTVLVIPPLTQTSYSENTCLGTISLTVRAYRPEPSIRSESFPFTFTLSTLTGEVIDEIVFDSNFPGQGSASATFGGIDLELDRNSAYKIRVEDNLGRTFEREAGPIGEAYSLNFDINVSGPLCAGDPGGVVEYIIYNAEVPLNFFGIYRENGTLVTEVYDIVSLADDYVIVNADNLSAGRYYIEVTDNFGCMGTQEFEIVLPDPIAVAERILDPSCFGASDGQIDLSISGGWSQPFDGSPIEAARDYSIQWYNSAGDELGTGTNSPIEETGEIVGMESVLSGLPAGRYYAEITESVRRFEIPDADPLVCAFVTPIYIVEGPEPLELGAVSNDISCHGAGDGLLSISPTGGTEAYTVNWYEGNFADLNAPDASGLTPLPEQVGEGSFQRQGIPAGDYAILLTDANGCFLAENFSISEPDPLSIFERTDLRENVRCFGEESGTIVVEVDGPTISPYFFEAFKDGATTGIKAAPIVSLGFSPVYFTDLPAGEYRIRVTDSNGCTFDIDGILIEQPATGLVIEEPLISDYSGFAVSCATATDGSIELTITGGEGELEYLWTGPDGFESTEKDIYDLSPGQYQFLVTDENNCSATIGSVEMIAPPPLTLSVDIPQYNDYQISCNGSEDGRITSLPSGGTGNYTFDWTGPDGFTAAGPTIDNLGPGVYSLIVTDENGCFAQADYYLDQPAPLIISENSDERQNITCFGEDTGALTIGLLPTLPPFDLELGLVGEVDPIRTISEFNGEIYEFTNLEAGDYWVRVRNSNGCTDIVEDIPIIQPTTGLELSDVMVSDFNGFEISCSGANDGSISLEVVGAQGDLNYSWTGPNGFTSESNVIAGLAPGSYELLVSDDSGCSLTETFELTEPDPLMATDDVSDFNGFGIQCHGGDQGFITLSISGGAAPLSINWTGPDGFVSSEPALENLVAGLYEVSITDQNGCQLSNSYNLLEPEELEIVELADEKIDVACFGQETGRLGVSLGRASTGPYRFTLENTDGTITREALANPDTTWIVENLPAGVYRVRVTDGNGCQVEITELEITQPEDGVQIESIDVSDYNGFNISCFGAGDGFIELLVTGGSGNYDFSWTGPNGFSSDQAVITDLGPGSYQVTVSDEYGCTLSETVDLNEPEMLALSEEVSDFNGFGIQCNGGKEGFINLNLTGGVGPMAISWTGPNGFSSNQPSLDNLAAGVYQVTIMDQNGCEVRNEFVLNQPEALTVDLIDQVDVLCFGEATGSIDIAVSGGIPDSYVYEWRRDGAVIESTTQNLDSIPAGSYSLTVTDANGCSAGIAQINILQPDAALQLTLNQTPISCYNANDANLSVDIQGGVEPYQVSWNIGSTQREFTGLGPGFYQVTVTDANGCSQIRDTVIEDLPVYDISPEVVPISCHGAADGSILLNLEGGEAPVRAIWDHGPEQSSLYNLGPGEYRVVVEDAKGCTIERTFNLVEPDLLVVVEQIQDALSCEDGQSGSIDLIVSGGTPPYSYNWSNGATSAGISGLTNGTYSVEITDQSGCFVSQSFRVNRPAPIVIDLVSTTTASCEPREIRETFDINVDGGVAPYDIQWSSGDVSADGYRMETDEPGTYFVTVTDGYGCVQSRSFEVDNSQILLDGDYASTSFPAYGENLVNFDVQFINNSSGNIRSYYWDFGDGNNSLEEAPLHRYQESGIYQVELTAYDAWGCVTSTTFEIEILDYFLEVPNVFSPNGDGINDSFFPKFLYIETLSFTIMNKWGEILFHTEELGSKGWDGSYRGQKAIPGNYIYKINFTTTDGRTFSDTGALMLLE